MITVQDLTKLIATLPEARVINADHQYWEQMVPTVVSSVLDEITSAYDFDFTLNEYSATSVAGTAEYELTGDDYDLRDIAGIRYGSDSTVLQRMRALDAHDLLENDPDLGGVRVWYQSGVNAQGFPKVTLIDTPSTAETIKVYYRKRNLELTNFPDDFGYVIARGVLAWVSQNHRLQFERALKRMIKRHKVGGKDYMMAQPDPHVAVTNRVISDLYGTG
jgi:hypothetical protein